MEQEPRLEITMNGERFVATRENTSLFTFLGELAVYDHIFIQTGEEDDTVMTGGYLFKNQEVWHEMAGFLFENLYPMHLNLPEVADCDRRAFEATMYPDIRSEDTFPQDWVTNE